MKQRPGERRRDPSLTILAAIAVAVGALSIWLSLAIAEAAEPAPGAAAVRPEPTVAVRAGEHAGYSRLVFDWPTAVAYRVERRGAFAILFFPAEARIDVERVRARLPRGVEAIDAVVTEAEVRVAVRVGEGATFRDFRHGPKVVLDILDRPLEAAPVEPSGPETAPRLSLVPPLKPALPVGQPSGATTAAGIAADEPAPETTAALYLVPPLKPAVPGAPLPDITAAGAFGDARFETAAVPQPIVSLPPAPAGGASVTLVRVIADGDGATLRVDFVRPVAAAAFGRVGAVWLVFDHVTRFDLGNLPIGDEAAIGEVEQLAHDRASILRFTGGNLAVARLRREGAAWLIDLRNGAKLPDVDIVQSVETDALERPRLALDPSGPTEPVLIEDPEVGDNLWVVPVLGAGEGVAYRRDGPQFQLLATRQGIVVAPIDDSLQVTTVADRVEIAAPGGLLVSAGETALAAAMVESRRNLTRLFDLGSWRRSGEGSLAELRQGYERRMAEAPPGRRTVARLDLARLYFSHGMAAEAAGLVELIEQSGGAALDPELLLLKGACRLLLNDPEGAAAALESPALDGEPEATLWRAVLAAARGEWEAAAEGFGESADLIADYPKPVRTRLNLAAAEAEIESGDPIGAIDDLDRLRADASTAEEGDRIAYLDGLRARREGRPPEAREIWVRLVHSTDLATRAQAGFELADLLLETDQIATDEAIERFETLRYGWRGGDLEFALLRRLGGLYAKQGKVREGLSLMRQAIANFPAHREAGAVAQAMAETFRAVYAGKAADPLSALQAVALYDEFRELTPTGPEGDQLIAGLVERLAAVDLLERAATLLEEQAMPRLLGPAKAAAGARVAELWLLDRKPGKALSVLTASAEADLPADLVRRRRELEVRALYDGGREREALALLQGDGDPGVLAMRADMLWRMLDWKGAATALNALLAASPTAEAAGQPSPAHDRAGLVLHQAIALSQAGDTAGLQALADRYGAVMAEGPLAGPFEVLVGDVDDAHMDTAERIAAIDRMVGFMDDYRKLLPAGEPQAVQ